MKTALPRIAFVVILVLSSLFPDEARATQVHAEPEGLIGHQIAHFFFALSMGTLIYWLRERSLNREPGWRYVQYAALLFILWNLNAITVHYLDERDDLFGEIDAGTWHARINALTHSDPLIVLYYFIKLDHLLCVPAIVFLYLGLRQLLKQAQQSRLKDQES
jgi:hypothetical protein